MRREPSLARRSCSAAGSILAVGADARWLANPELQTDGRVGRSAPSRARR